MIRATCMAAGIVILAATCFGAWAAQPAGQKTQDQKKDEKKADDKKTEDKKADDKKTETKQPDPKVDEKKFKIQTLTDKNKYAKVDLMGGEKLLVKLPCNPTTGYTWVLGSKADPKFILDGKPTYVSDEGKAIGGGGTMTFTFMALTAGDVEVELHYLRPFEKGRDPEKTYSFTARIK